MNWTRLTYEIRGLLSAHRSERARDVDSREKLQRRIQQARSGDSTDSIWLPCWKFRGKSHSSRGWPKSRSERVCPTSNPESILPDSFPLEHLVSLQTLEKMREFPCADIALHGSVWPIARVEIRRILISRSRYLDIRKTRIVIDDSYVDNHWVIVESSGIAKMGLFVVFT